MAELAFEVGQHTQKGSSHVHNEDALVVHQFESGGWYFAVIDGHGLEGKGKEATEFVAKNLHLEFAKMSDQLPIEECFKEAFVTTDRELILDTEKRSSDCGCCVLACVLQGRQLTLGHVGDCRAVFENDGKVQQLTFDHDPRVMEERKRVEELGGYFSGGVTLGGLQVTRSLGDFVVKRRQIDALKELHKAQLPSPPPPPPAAARTTDAKSEEGDEEEEEEIAPAYYSCWGPITRTHSVQLHLLPYSLETLETMSSVTGIAPEHAVISPLPAVTHHTIPPSKKGSFLVLASDGVWSVLSNKEVCAIVSKTLAEQHDTGVNRAQMASSAVCAAASSFFNNGDDISAVVVWFKN